NGRFIKDCLSGADIVAQLWTGRPQQRGSACDVRSGEGSAAVERRILQIIIIEEEIRRAKASGRCRDIWFQKVASNECEPAAAAKVSDGVGAGVQSPNRISILVKRRRTANCGTVRTFIAYGAYHHDAGRPLGCDGGLQTSGRTAFRRRTIPRVGRNIGGQC